MDPAPDLSEFERTALGCLQDCYAFALSLARNSVDAEDLVQETFLRAQRCFDQFEPGTNAKAWLFTILRRIHIDRHRRARVRPTYKPDEELESFAIAPAPPEASGWLDGIEPGDVLNALDSVPEPFRVAVRLRDIDGFAYKEIGRVLGVPPGTVMSRIHRGRESLKATLVALVEERMRSRRPAQPPPRGPEVSRP